MPLLISALLGGVMQLMGSFIARALVALGLSFVTFKGLSTLVSTGEQLIVDRMRGMPADAIQFFAWMNLDKGITMIFSAITTGLIIKTVAGNVTKLNRTGGGGG